MYVPMSPLNYILFPPACSCCFFPVRTEKFVLARIDFWRELCIIIRGDDMKLSFFRFAVFLTSMTLMLCSCGTPQTPEQSAASSVESSVQASIATSLSEHMDEWYEETMERSERDIYINYSCISYPDWDTARFKNVLGKAESGEEITVAYIGGSITEGYTVEPEECWAYLTHQWLCEKYPETKINYVNAGLSGTNSTLGLIRSDRDVIAPYGDPDIVFIEFAVNDADDNLSLEGYESLVRKMLDLDSHPAVALIFMRTDSGYTAQERQRKVGELYGLPMISITDMLGKAFEEGYMTWADYSDDGAHPNPEGCKLIAECVEYMLGLMEDKAITADSGIGEFDFAYDVEPVYGSDFVNMKMYDSSNIAPLSMGEYTEASPFASFPNAWARKGGENEGISFELTFDDLFVVYQCNKGKSYGTAEVFVDGEPVGEVTSFAEDGWNNPVPQLVMRGDGVKTHKVELKIKSDPAKSYFGLLAFGCSD